MKRRLFETLALLSAFAATAAVLATPAAAALAPTPSAPALAEPTKPPGARSEAPAAPQEAAPSPAATPGPRPDEDAQSSAPPSDSAPPADADAKTEAPDAEARGSAEKPGSSAKPPAPEDAKPAPPSGPLPPLRPLFRVELTIDELWHTDRGYDLFDRDDVNVLGGLRAEVDVLRWSEDGWLALQLGLSGGATSSGAVSGFALQDDYGFSAGDPQWEEQRVFAGVVPRVALLRWFGAHVRVHGGASFVETRLAALDESFKTKALDPYVAAGAGVSIQPPAGRISKTRSYFNSLTGGGQLEVGYALVPALELSLPNHAASPPEQRLTQTGANLGSIERSGLYISLSAFARF